MNNKWGLWFHAALICCLLLTVSACKSKKGTIMFALPQGEAQHIVFVTSAAGNGKLSTWADAGGMNGLQAADAVCQARANLAGLPGTYRAWLSDDTDDAYCRIQGLSGKAAANCGAGNLVPAGGPWVRTDGTPFSGDINDLFLGNGYSGVVYTPIRYDENGNLMPSGHPYWTGTYPNGTVAHSFTCNNWTGVAAGNEVIEANVDSTTSTWTNWFGNDSDCSTFEMSLVCFQAGAGPSLGAFAKPGKKVFITSGSYNGDLVGLAGADAKCQASAAAANIAAGAGNFQAWLSTSGANAIDRIGASNGPWVTLDGIVVAKSKAELSSNRLQTTITRTETGGYVDAEAWSGTNDHGLATGEKCADWSDSGASNHGIYGFANDAFSIWSNAGTRTCDSSEKLYCFEK